METLRLSDGESLIEIDLVQLDPDAYISIRVDSRGFLGRNDLHILDSEFRNFCEDLVAMQNTLKGKASLASVAEDELSLSIAPSDSLGHFSVVGSTGYHLRTGLHSYWHQVTFGFTIEPTQLDRAVKVDWVKENAN